MKPYAVLIKLLRVRVRGVLFYRGDPFQPGLPHAVRRTHYVARHASSPHLQQPQGLHVACACARACAPHTLVSGVRCHYKTRGIGTAVHGVPQASDSKRNGAKPHEDIGRGRGGVGPKG